MEFKQLFIQWDSTNDCNLRCSHCYHNREGHGGHIQNEDMMDLDEVKSMIDDLHLTSKRWKMIPRFHISGGEPLMRKDLMEILDYSKFYGMPTRLLTNGTLITSEKAKELYKRGIKRLQISIDGKKSTHNTIRRKSFAYDRAMDGIRNSAEAGIKVTVSMTAMQSNKRELEDVIQNSIRAGAEIFGFQSYVPNLSLGLNDPEFMGAKDTCDLFRESRRLSDIYGNKIKILETEVLWGLMQRDDSLKQESRETGKFLGGCGAGYSGITVLSNGVVYPCRRLPIEIGHISEGLIKLITEKEVMKNLRDLEQMKKNYNCEYVSHCRGCRAIAYATTGDYLAKDPMCFKEFIKSEDLKEVIE
jgi:AdoMet-dependent heme synthase